MTKNYVSTEKAAEVLGCTPTHIALLCRQGKLDAIKPLGRWRVAQDALNSLVEEGENEDGTDNERIDI